MNYSQKTIEKAREIQSISDAFEEVKATLSVLEMLDLRGVNDRLAYGIQKVVYQALEELEAIQCHIEQCHSEEE